MTSLGRHDDDGFTIFFNRTDTYVGDGSGGTWFHWQCSCDNDSRGSFRTESMMWTSAAQHIGEHKLKGKAGDV